MIKFLVKLKEYLISNIKIRKLVHYTKELNSNDSLIYQPSSDLNGDVSFQHFSETSPDIVKLFKFEEKTSIRENNSCIIVSIKNEPAGCIFFNSKPLARLVAPFEYEIKLDVNSSYIHTLFIEKKFRGNGLAKLLYLESFKRLSKNFRYVHVITETENFIANNMVREIGFKKRSSFALIKIFQLKINYATNNVFEKLLLNFLLYLAKKAYRFIRLPITIFEKIYVKKNKSFFKLFILSDLKSDGILTVAYFSKTNLYLPMAQRIFHDGYEIRSSKKVLSRDLEKKIVEAEKRVDLLIIEDDFKRIHKQFKSHEDIKFIPKLVLQRNSSFVNTDDLLKNKDHGLRHDFKAAKKHGYSYIFTKDKSLIKFFYEHMYVPYISNRHNNFAFIDSFNLIYRSSKKGGLIFLKHKNRFLSGVVVEFKNKELHNKYFGVLNGDVSLIKKDVLSALYYFCFRFAQEKSFRVVDFGYSRGFLNDGVLRYKAKWNSKVSFDRKQNNVFLIKIIKLNKATKHFLLSNPFISLEDETSLVGNIFLDSDAQQQKEVYINRLKVDGLDRLRIVYLNGLQNKTKEEIINLKLGYV